MNQLATIDDKFVDEYIFTHRNKLGKPTMGGTDWRFADIVAPSFKEILEIAKPKSVLEIGFNAGGSALMFLSIDQFLDYDSIDIQKNEKSQKYLYNRFVGFDFIEIDSKAASPSMPFFQLKYDMVLVDGDHSMDGVISDIELSLKFDPEYILFDDWYHPSHRYISEIVTERYKDVLTVVKIWEFNQAWQGYSMALCKVKNNTL